MSSKSFDTSFDVELDTPIDYALTDKALLEIADEETAVLVKLYDEEEDEEPTLVSPIHHFPRSA